jgi:hypothetical protein
MEALGKSSNKDPCSVCFSCLETSTIRSFAVFGAVARPPIQGARAGRDEGVDPLADGRWPA